MFADRMIRLSVGPAASDCRRDDTDTPFGMVRTACQEFLCGLPPNDRPTLVLLGSQDIGGGILEHLLELSPTETPCSAGKLAVEILDAANVEPDLMLVVCMAQPSLEAWDSDDWAGSREVKDNEFFVRLFERYRLAILIGGVSETGTQDDDRKRVIARISRSLNSLSRYSGCGNWLSRRQELKGDIRSLAARASSVLGSDFVIRYFGPDNANELRQFLRSPLPH